MKYLFNTLLFLNITTVNLYAQEPVLILYATKRENDEYCLNKKDKPKSFVLASPIVVFDKGKYREPDGVVTGIDNEPVFSNPEDYKKYKLAEKFYSHILKPNKFLYNIFFGEITDSLMIKERVLYGCTDQQSYSALLDHYPKKNGLLTNNSTITNKISKLPKLKLVIKKDIFNTFIKMGEVDIDGDGFSEQIFRISSPDGFYFYEVFSFKKEKWHLVYKGTYEGG